MFSRKNDTAQKIKFSIKEILNGKLHFLCSVRKVRNMLGDFFASQETSEKEWFLIMLRYHRKTIYKKG